MAPAPSFEFDDDPARVDMDVVWAYLSSEAYWGRWRAREDVERQVRGAWRVVGVYERDGGRMVGFARALSDGVAYAYLADLFLLADVRGHGLGAELIRVMIDDGPGSAFRWTLHTDDAHELYGRFGFARPDQTYMERPMGWKRGPRR